MDSNEFMTLGEVAEYLRVNKKTIYRLLDRRAIPSVKVGRQWRFNKNSIDEWLSQNSSASSNSILIIDDDQATCDYFKNVLEPEGLQVSTSTDPFEGLKLLQDRNFDIAFVDLKMPKMDGAELSRKIKEIDPEIPIIIVTGYPDSELMDEALKSGPVAVIKKPFTTTDLFAVINNYLHINIR